ncbi:putative quinol monooxygenase [Enterococcus sp. LJL99]
MLKLIAEDFIEPQHIPTVFPLYKELVEETRKEQGCISYELYHDLREEGHFIFIEEWVDKDALTEHTESAHFKRLVPLIDRYAKKEGEFTHMKKVF